MKRSKLSLEELKRLSPEEYSSAPKIPIIVVGDNIRSALNIGSIFRTCDAFAVEKLILTGISARPPHREISKTAIGATDTVEWEYLSDPMTKLRELKNSGYAIIAIEQTNDAVPLSKFEFRKYGKVVLIFGNEVGGVSDEIVQVSDVCVEINQYGTKHSLNVSVCAGIVLWAFNSNLLD